MNDTSKLSSKSAGPVGIAASLLLALGWWCLAAPGLGQVPVMQPDSFSVDESGGHAQGVAMGADGGFVVTWAYGNVGARRYIAPATPGGWLPLGSASVFAHASSIARDASGRTVVVWKDGNYIIVGRRFTAAGNALGETFVVTAAAGVSVGDPHVASDPSGNFVVAWTSSSEENVVARRFDSDGAPLGYEFPVSEFTTGIQSCSGIAASRAGFVVTWNGEGPSGWNVFGRRFDPSGAPLTGDLPIGASLVVADTSDVAMSAAGDFVVVWSAGAASYARRFSASGAALGDAFAIGATGYYSEPRVASDSFGNFLVSWTGNGITGRSFDAGGNTASAEFQVATTPYPGGYLAGRSGAHPALADDGSFVVVWTDLWDYGSVGASTVTGRKSGMHAARGIDLAPAAGAAAGPGSGNGVLEPGETMAVHTAWVNETDAGVELSGTAPFFTGPAGARVHAR